MYCTNCGCEVTVGYYCSNCGKYAGESAEIVAVAEPLTDSQRLKKALSSKLFLTMSILKSVDIGIAALIILILPLYFSILPIDYAGIISGVLLGFCALFLILPICELVGYWKTYKRNANGDYVDASGPKILLTVTHISYVISWIGAVIFFILGVVCFAAGILGAANGYDLGEFGDVAMSIFGIVFIIAAISWIVILILYVRKIVRFWKEVIASAETGVINITKPRSLYIWMLVMGIISAAGALSGGIFALIPAAILICCSFWVKENFAKNE